MTGFVRDPRTGGCTAGASPANPGFSPVVERRPSTFAIVDHLRLQVAPGRLIGLPSVWRYQLLAGLVDVRLGQARIQSEQLGALFPLFGQKVQFAVKRTGHFFLRRFAAFAAFVKFWWLGCHTRSPCHQSVMEVMAWTIAPSQIKYFLVAKFGRRPNTDKVFVQRSTPRSDRECGRHFKAVRMSSPIPSKCCSSVTPFYPLAADETMALAMTLFSSGAEDFLKPSPVTVVVIKQRGSIMQGDVISLIHQPSCRSSLHGMRTRPLAG
jgi:hypothetical protein